MKKMRVRFFVITFLSIVALIGITRFSYADDATSYYDNLLANDQLVIKTDLSPYESNDGLQSYVNSVLLAYNNYFSDIHYDLWVQSCDYEQKTCVFNLSKIEHSESEIIKTYENISIVIDLNITTEFPMVNGKTLKVDYDEDMLSSEEEKENYINNYLNSFSNSVGASYCSYYYRDFDSGNKAIFKTCYNNGKTTSLQIKAVENIVFEYSEGAYSNDFKNLTSGTLTVKTDLDINKEMLQQYLSYFYNNPYSFSIDGEIKNNKVFIKMSKWNGSSTEVIEKHLVNLVKDENVDIGLFDRVGYGNSLNIKADMPLDQNSYIQNYFNATNYSFNNDDGSREQYFGRMDYNTGALWVQYFKWNSENKVVDAQIHGITVSFVGYDDAVSGTYENKVGNELIVNADELNSGNISRRASSSGLILLGCNNDYSECDLALLDYEAKTIEIHKIAITLDSDVSDVFKEAFGIKTDGTIDIIAGGDISESIYYSYYDDSNLRSLNYNCSPFRNECELSMSEWGNSSKNSKYETHKIAYNLIQSTARSNIFSSLVKDSIDLYPGENNSFWDSINSYSFTKSGEYDPRVEKNSCDSQERKCLVTVLNSDKKLEVHPTSVAVRDGISDEFEQIIPDGSVTINSVHKDDAEFIRNASQAYFQSKHKTNAYLLDYQDGKAKAWLDYFETHTVNVDFVEPNEDHAAVIRDIASRLESSDLSFTIDDLEYINYFYYNYNAPFPLPSNMNSKMIRDVMETIIDNDHVGYYLVGGNGGGYRFGFGSGSEIVLYYDGIAYEMPNTYLATQLNHVIYIPDDTPENTEAFVVAAQKRIDDYFGQDSGISIRFFDELDETEILDSIDLDGFDGNSYRIAYKDKEQDVLIIRNSSKMQTGTFNASDISNNIDVSSDDATYPMDTVVSSEEINENNTKYKWYLKKLGLSEAQIIDMNLYSTILGQIDSFNNVSFDVRLPILDKFKDKTLYAYYIGDDGKIEEHPIILGGFFGYFRTNHFSTYIISEKVDDKILEKANSPKTFDGVKVWFVVGGLSLLVVTGIAVKAKREK